MSVIEVDPIRPDVQGLHQLLFPDTGTDIKSMNGVAGDQAKWYGITMNKSQQLVGICTIGKQFIYNFGIHPDYQKQGYGSKLLRHVIDQNSKTTLHLFVKKDNKAALQLYKKHKFKITLKAFKPPVGQLCMIRQ